ncbi:Redoxin [Pseudovirgaria hyperparasitica]|uniref:Redoxin n=1 Tax=Pseudovirgaria hyperparasitica TaxID=470096 RepID=A0A6A6VV63_9PEZI|nr:Redoxin [Pseudovirgaria hyperparasitica]KAF2753510.1 Redoxin [Pseudovirgaria hyperparasitica]
MSGLIDKIKSGSHKAIATGASISSTVALKEKNPEQGTVVISQLTGKNIIVGVPGAFTPPCSSQVPGYIENAQAFVEKGVAGIYIVAVNDAFTTQAWKEKLTGGAEAPPAVHFLADDTGAFTKEIGMSFDATGLLGGPRSQRYVAVLDGPIVKQIYVEDAAPSVTVTKAENVLQALN